MSRFTQLAVSHPTLQGFVNNHWDMHFLYLIESGSALWGMKTETSDTDFFGVYLPPIEDCITQNVRHTISHNSNPDKKNTSLDVDIKVISIHQLLRQLLKGDPDTVSNVLAPSQCVMYESDRFKAIRRSLPKLINNRMVKSAMGGGLNRYKQWEKTGDPKMIYHAVRFLWISKELLVRKSVRLPVSDKIKGILSLCKENPQFGKSCYDKLEAYINLIQTPLPPPNPKLSEKFLLSFYE